jgi:hypothetical protein
MRHPLIKFGALALVLGLFAGPGIAQAAPQPQGLNLAKTELVKEAGYYRRGYNRRYYPRGYGYRRGWRQPYYYGYRPYWRPYYRPYYYGYRYPRYYW